MAEAKLYVSREELSCSICLELLNNPVTIPCGHSYCMNCIRLHWDANACGIQYNCPQCRKTFHPRPVLGKNVVVAEMVEKLKRTERRPAPRTEPQPAPRTEHQSAPRTERRPAPRTEPQPAPRTEHQPAPRTERRPAPRTERRPAPRTEPQPAPRTVPQTVPLSAPQPVQVSHIEARPGDVECDVCTGRKYKAIKSCLVCLNSLCQIHFQRHENAFKGDRHCLIDATEQLQEMICPIHNELLEIFCHTDQMSICIQCTTGLHKNHDVTSGAERINQGHQSQWQIPEHLPMSSSSYSVPPAPFSFDVVSRSDYARKTLSKRLKKKVDDFLNSEILLVSGCVMRYTFPTDGPKNRSEILQYSHRLSMDSNTMNETLLLSGGNRVATNTGKLQLYPEHPDRFDCWPQVLCKESVCGRAYWEFEWSGKAGVGVSLAYKSICRKGNGDESKFGCNDQSMNLDCSPFKYTFWDSNKKTKLNVNTSKIHSRLGVYVDYTAGFVFFFSISFKMKLIYIVHTKFTQPIFPGFKVYCGSSVKLCDPSVNCA
ncbi:finTRIM family, member 54 [Garra rufa]|uniref:finTRIM family, member 54 n=1 Tax=Garra rufa TaxID=137080 RepID=UPI003CCE93AD